MLDIRRVYLISLYYMLNIRGIRRTIIITAIFILFPDAESMEI